MNASMDVRKEGSHPVGSEEKESRALENSTKMPSPDRRGRDEDDASGTCFQRKKKRKERNDDQDTYSGARKKKIKTPSWSATADGLKITIYDVHNFLSGLDNLHDLETCPHVSSLESLPRRTCFGDTKGNLSEISLDRLLQQSSEHEKCGAGCLVCCSENENWLCLHCGRIFCGRYVEGHSEAHGLKANHPIVMSLRDLSFWCYGCQTHLEHPFYPRLRKIYMFMHNIRFPHQKTPPMDAIAKAKRALTTDRSPRASPILSTTPLQRQNSLSADYMFGSPAPGDSSYFAGYSMSTPSGIEKSFDFPRTPHAGARGSFGVESGAP